MNVQTKEDAFSIQFFNQGLTAPPTNEVGTSTSTILCPHHLRQTIPPGVHPAQRLEYTPLSELPIGLSGNCRVGNSASGSCNCGHGAGPLEDGMSRELDDIIQESKRNKTHTTSRS
ncbi:hypothetical protein BDW02DRAFT_568812 [Decorospora gaudefroyi]|uniref:Uncharacterized protein n=1 Tax=Decorospora gaudefroyi TaxID=184978 RepID=A0A6A5KMF7_9PLEO|nr:hypothetical protein BDW02DRAFT_568812 [Decorospora gaudefroyi]